MSGVDGLPALLCLEDLSPDPLWTTQKDAIMAFVLIFYGNMSFASDGIEGKGYERFHLNTE